MDDRSDEPLVTGRDAASGGFPLRFAEVAAIIGVLLLLAALLIPFSYHSHCGNIREECASNLHQLGLALIQYAQDYANHYPHATDDGFIAAAADAPAVPVDGGPTALIGCLYPEYVPDIRIFECPYAPPGRGEQTSFGYDPRHLNIHPPAVAIVADRPPSARPRPGEGSPNHVSKSGGQNVLFIDCHAEWKKTTNVGYANDEIYVDNTGEVIGDSADNRRDSCILDYGGSIGP